jgi:hypothetical protein
MMPDYRMMPDYYVWLLEDEGATAGLRRGA